VTNRDRSDGGQFTTDTIYKASNFLAAVDEHDHPTTTDIADRIGCSYDTANRWLHQLEEEDQVESTKIGNSLVWSQHDES
jgi:DNA-binding IclR family transcriptional regulator